jgi:uncharacterized OsmC-like protein
MSRHDDAPAAPMVVTHLSGLKFRIQTGAHELIVDQPLRGGGEDAGPTPLALLAASLGSCVALYVHQFLVSRGLSAEGLRVEVSEHPAQQPRRVGQFDVRVIPPATMPALYRPMLESVAHVCPAHNTLVSGATVKVHIDALENPASAGGAPLTEIAR